MSGSSEERSNENAKGKTEEKRKEVAEIKGGINFALKAKYAAYTTLIFFLIANPETYKLVQKFVGGFITVASEYGCPTPQGFFIHTGVFFLVLWSFMLFPKDF